MHQSCFLDRTSQEKEEIRSSEERKDGRSVDGEVIKTGRDGWRDGGRLFLSLPVGHSKSKTDQVILGPYVILQQTGL